MSSIPSTFSPKLDFVMDFLPDGYWSEDGDIEWLPIEYGLDATRVKRKAFCGKGLPVTPAREFYGGDGYNGVIVKQVWIRPGEEDELGWADEMAYVCKPDHPKATPAWEVTFG